MLLHLLPHRKALASPGALHPSAPNLMQEWSCSPFLEGFCSPKKKMEKGVEKQMKNVSLATFKKNKSWPGKRSDVISAEHMRGECSCILPRFV